MHMKTTKPTNNMKEKYETPRVRWTEFRPDRYFCISMPAGLEDTYDDIITED